MTKRIFRSILFVALTVFLSAAVLILGVLYGYFTDTQKRQLRIQLELAAQGAEHEGIDYFRGLLISNYRVTWMNSRGTVIYDSLSDSTDMENHLEREEFQQALSAGYGESRRYSSTLADHSLYAAKLLQDGTVLRLSITQSSVLSLVLGMMQPFCVICFVALCLSVFFAIRLSKKIVSPLTRLDLDHPFAGGGYEELSPLLYRIDSQQKQLKRQKEALLEKQLELERAEQIRREFTANVSHELKTPLQSISGYAELMQNNMVKNEDIIPFAGKIYDEARRMVRLVEDIISLSRLDGGAEDMQRSAIDLYDTATQALNNLASAAQSASVTLELTGEPSVFDGIPQLLYSIVYNLCDNAVKYNRPGGKVNVSVKPVKGEIVLTVSDTGIGIPSDQQDRIFERFYRVDKSRSREVGGTGLGLSIVKHAAMVHHARIRLDSTPGQGSTVTVRFPV